jgi:hypothetical protein
MMQQEVHSSGVDWDIRIWAQTCILISFSMICCAAWDQFFSTNYRFNARQTCTLKLAWYLTFVAPCISLVHSVFYGLSFGIQPSFGCVISNPIWSRYASFFLYPILVGGCGCGWVGVSVGVGGWGYGLTLTFTHPYPHLHLPSPSPSTPSPPTHPWL